MKEYIVISELIEENVFFDRMNELEVTIKKEHFFGKPGVVLPFEGSKKSLYELLGYGPKQVTIYPVKYHKLPDDRPKVEKII